jgi:ribosomal protein S18 acetylase RimI-like enzyme
LLCKVAVEKARALGAKKVMLYTQSRLVAAIGIYHQLGFKNIPLGAGIYKRADIKMELYL